MAEKLSTQELEALRQITTPTIANAIEVFNIQPRNVGFMTPDIRCILPELGIMVGYAVTCTIRADQPPGPGREVPRPDWWDYILTIPEPRVVVVQDLDRQPIGSMWGEVNGSIHKALGCIGTVTDGSATSTKSAPWGSTASPPVSWFHTPISTSSISAIPLRSAA